MEAVLQACVQIGRGVNRLWRAMFPNPPEPPRSARETQFQTEVPCQGDAFSFQVTIRELWTYPGGPDVLERMVTDRVKAQQMVVERQLRAISRRFPPDAVADFERAATTELGSPMNFPESLGLDCSYSVHAAPDEVLHQHLRDTEIKRLEAGAEHERKEKHLNHLEHMRDRWFSFLRQFDGDSLGSLAAQLAGDPEHLADVIAKRTSEQERLKDELRKLCDTTSEAYRDKDVFEFVISTDSALSRLLRHVGIDSTSEPDGGLTSGENEAANGAHPSRG